MLSIAPARSCKYYVEYHLKESNPPGYWLGNGAKRAGLEGDVRTVPFTNLFEGFSPDRTQKYVQNAGARWRDGRPKHLGGWDGTFNAEKTVSIETLLADESKRPALLEAHRMGVGKGAGYLEAAALWTKRDHDGTRIEQAVGLIGAAFEEYASRANEPHLHTHCVVFNAAFRSDGTTGTILGRSLLEHKFAAGALYRAEVAFRLQALGYEIVRKDGSFKLAHVPKALADRFSTRRHEIKAALEQRGFSSARAAAVATLATRPKKQRVSLGDLLPAWREIGRAFGYSAPKLRPAVPRPVEIEQAIQAATTTVTRSASYFNEREFIRRLAEEAPGRGFGADQVLATARRHLDHSPDIVRLGRRGTELLYTTREIYALEEKLLSQVRVSKTERGASVEATVLERAIAKTEKGRRITLSDEQLHALYRLTTVEKGSIRVLSGIAGSGKTSVLETARRAWESQGYRVMGATVSGRAADELRTATGIRSTTVARLLLHTDKKSPRKAYAAAQEVAFRDLHKGGFGSTAAFLRYVSKATKPGTLEIDMKVRTIADAYAEAIRKARGKPLGFSSTRAFLRAMQDARTRTIEVDSRTVLVVDEAGVVDTAQMAKLIEETRKAGATLLLVGDKGQLQPVGPGAPFARIGRELGFAELKDIQRQREEWARSAVKSLTAGEALEALRESAERGLLHIGRTREETRRELVTQWVREGGAETPGENLILATTRYEVAILNRLSQESRQVRGTVTFDGIGHGAETLCEGDRVLFSKNSAQLGVRNGNVGTAEALDVKRRRLGVRLDDGRLVLVNLKDYPHLSLGYCLTVFKAQGATTEKCKVLLGGPGQDLESTYTALSRAKGETKLYIDRLEAGDSLTALANELQRSRVKELAHDVLDRAEREPKQEPPGKNQQQTVIQEQLRSLVHPPATTPPIREREPLRSFPRPSRSPPRRYRRRPPDFTGDHGGN